MTDKDTGDKGKKLGGDWELEIPGEHRLRHENLAYDIDVWYPRLADLTFPTLFLSLSHDEARAMVRYYSARFLGRAYRGDGIWFNTGDIKILDNLRSRIDKAIQSDPQMSKSGAFVRLCGRSPKDADPLHPESVQSQFDTQIEALKTQYGYDPEEANTKLMAIARVHWLRVVDGTEALNLLLTSERVFCDIRDWLQNGGVERIVLRAWDPRLTYDREFRMYVHNGVATALSQYDHFGYYPHLIKEKEAILDRITRYWREQVVPRMGKVVDYVVDFGDLGEKDGVILIELSPYMNCTGAAMFNWSRDADQLRDGPLEFRLRTEPYPDVESLVQSGWTLRWNQHFEPYTAFFKNAHPDPKEQQQQQQSTGLFSSITNALWSLIGWTDSEDDCTETVFIVGTLKRGFVWHKKYLAFGKFLGVATTVDPVPMVLDECGVPKMFISKDCTGAKRVKGELWRVSKDVLRDIEYFEDACTDAALFKPDAPERCELAELAVEIEGQTPVNAHCFVLKNPVDSIKNGPFIDEYTQDMCKSSYDTILHVVCQQEHYLHYKLCSF